MTAGTKTSAADTLAESAEEKSEKAAVESKSEATTKEVPEAQPETIRLSMIVSSPLNARADSKGDDEVKALAEDIKKHGVLHPVTLRETEGGRFEAVIGTRRLKALTNLRGADGELRQGEFKVVTWADKECLAASFAENERRQDLSPYEEGRYLNKMAEVLGLNDGQLERLTNLDRPRINDVRALAKDYEKLPPSWQKELAKAGNYRLSDSPAITLSHFKVVRKHIGDGPVSDEIRQIMEMAAAQSWTTAQLKAGLNDGGKSKEQPAATPDSGTLKAEKASTPANRDEPPVKADDEVAGTPADKDQPVESRPVEMNPPVQKRDKRRQADYEMVLEALRSAYANCGSDNKTADAIQEIIGRVEKALEADAGSGTEEAAA